MHEPDRNDSSPRDPGALSRRDMFLAAVGALALAVIVGARLSAYGLWDPWELTVADAARKLGKADGMDRPAPWAVLAWTRWASQLLGTADWVGRLPSVASGVATLFLAWCWGWRLAGARVAGMLVLVLGTSLLFLFQSRLMLGDAAGLAAASGVMLGCSVACFSAAPGDNRLPQRGLWFAVALASSGVGILAGGALLTIVPPSLAVSFTFLWLHGARAALPRAQRAALWASLALAVLTTALVVRALFQHGVDGSLWIGKPSSDGVPPTYEHGIANLFHGFAPWSAVLPVALASALRVDDDPSPQGAFKLCAVLWAVFAYAAQAIMLSSFGGASFGAPAALAACVALWLDETSRSRRPNWPESIVILLLVALLIRDFSLYPASPLAALELTDLKLPDTFNPQRAWAICLGTFAFAVAASSMATPDRLPLDLRAPYRHLARTFRASLPHKLWIAAGASVVLGALVFAGCALVFADALRLTSLARRVGLVLGACVPAIPLAVALGQLAYQGAGRLASWRVVPMLAAAMVVAGYASQIFLPQVSEQFSPRAVFDAYRRFARPGEPLARHRVEGRAAAHYSRSDVQDLPGQAEAVSFLAGQGRRWIAFNRDDLAELDRSFRKVSGKHLFVVSEATSAVALAASLPVEGVTDYNPLARTVLQSPPAVQHPLGAVFGDRVELVGFNLDLPGRGTVGAGQTFKVTWVWKALTSDMGSYEIFLHLDGQDQRLNGDHNPVDGEYPIRLWNAGDVIIDSQELRIPATYPPGTYTLYVGLFRGESRLSIVTGPKDGANRLRAGTLTVR